MTRLRRRAVVLLLALGVGCNSSPTAPTPTTTAPVDPITQMSVAFDGVVGPSGSVSRSFTARQAGTVTVSLSNITPATALILGLGIPRIDGTGCLIGLSATAVGGQPVQLSTPVATGVFCLQVLAPAVSANTVTYRVNLSHP